MKPPERIIAIIERVAAEAGLPARALTGPRCTAEAYRARQRAYAECRAIKLPCGRPPSFAQIGSWFGGRDHTTIMHGVQAHERRVAG